MYVLKGKRNQKGDLPSLLEKGCERKMAVLATPNKNSYVIKKEYVSEFTKSKTDASRLKDIQQNAQIFAKNNLQTKSK